MHYIVILLLSFFTHASPEIEDARKSIRALIKPLLAGQSNEKPRALEKFRVDGCEKKKINWMDVLLRRTDATMNFRFGPGCDIQGSIRPMIVTPFPAKLDIRNIESYSRIETMNTVTANLETQPILNLEMREGTLLGKKSKVKFEADYAVRISPMEQKTVTENLGGELRISEINGKKVNIKEKILVK